MVVARSSPCDAPEFDIEMLTMEKMEKCLEAAARSFQTVRSGRATPALLDRIAVEYYGTPTPLRQVATINAPEAALLVVQPYEPSTISVIEKAIVQSDLGLTPTNNGRLIRIRVPPLTTERRKQLAKTVGKLAEEARVAIRNVRREAMRSLEHRERDNGLGKDEKRDLGEAVQKLTDEYVEAVDKLARAKTDELLTL